MTARAYMEPFVLLVRLSQDDGMGGAMLQWEDGAAFLGGISHAMAKETEAGGLRAAMVQTVLLHEEGVLLTPGCRVRRVADGAVYRVLGSSEDMRAPRGSMLKICQVPVERLVIPQ